MKKIVLLLCAVLVVFPLVMTGCGVAKDEYNAVVAERDAAQAQAASLQAEKDALQADNDTLQAEKDALQSELDANKADVTSLVADLNKKLEALYMIDGYFSSSLKYVAGEISEGELNYFVANFMSDFDDVLDDIGNNELSELWDGCVAADATGDADTYASNLVEIIELLQDMIDDDVAAIEAASASD